MVIHKYKLKLEFVDYLLFKYFLVLDKWLQTYLSIFYFINNKKKNIITILKSPHVNKTSREQFSVIERNLFYFFNNKEKLIFFWNFYNFFLSIFIKFSRFLFYTKQGIFYF